MKSFACDDCGQLVFFENSVCTSCGAALGYSRERARILTLDRILNGAAGCRDGGRDWRICANLGLVGCNWLAPADRACGLCDCCLLTRTRPSDVDAPGMQAWQRAEAAKRRLLFQIDDLGLDVVARSEDPARGLAFDLLSSSQVPVTTGHDSGVITLDLAEGNDGYREAMRVRLDEPYRTLLGHLRHEIGHHYWGMLVEGKHEAEFRECFGDERQDYAAALHTHYAHQPVATWQHDHVSAYATAHPWEDWAETFAHYLHILDAIQTAASFGVSVDGPRALARHGGPARLSAVPVEDVQQSGGIEEIIDIWLPLTYALNQVSRSIGRGDLYPFVLAPPVLAKLGLVHRLVSAATSARGQGRDARRAG